MTWRIDYTSQIRADLVGLDPDVNDAITDLLLAWTVDGPPRQHQRSIAGTTFYEQDEPSRW